MIISVVKKLFSEEYPHMAIPSIVYAAVSAVSTEAGNPWCEYTLEVLDRFGNPDAAVPPLPGIKSKQCFQQGAVLAIAYAYGELNPVIIEEVSL